MKKVLISLIVVSCILFQASGCAKGIIEKNENESYTVKKTVSKSENDIKEIAYQYLSKEDKNTVMNWNTGKVEKYKSDYDHSIGSPNGLLNIVGKETYKVIFRTSNEALLGPITIYIDADSYDVLGGDLRD